MPKEKVLQVQRESKFDGLLPKPKLLHRIVHMSTNPHEAETLDFDLADRLVKSLRVSGVGVGDIAVELGVTRQTVANWTSGRTAPKRVYRKQWALFTGVPYEWLETGQKKDPQPKGPGVQELPDGFDPSTFSLQAAGSVVIPFPNRHGLSEFTGGLTAKIINFPGGTAA